MNLEIKEDNSSYSFSYTQYENGLAKNITTATITLYGTDGTEFIASSSMTISNNVATKTVDFSTDPSAGNWVVDRNYKAVMIIDGIDRVRLFDIVKYPFVNEVEQSDLELENKEGIELAGLTDEGTADSGSSTTIVDSTKIGADDPTGGKLYIYPLTASGITTEHTITDFTTGSGTITFTPPRDTAVTIQRYEYRTSFDNDITRAGNIVQTDLWKMDRRAYLIIDNTQINDLIIYKFFERLYALRRSRATEDDTNNVKYIYYKDLYDSTLNGLPLNYDLDEDGAIGEDETGLNTEIRMIR
jgi:hypothetical protein